MVFHYVYINLVLPHAFFLSNSKAQPAADHFHTASCMYTCLQANPTYLSRLILVSGQASSSCLSSSAAASAIMPLAIDFNFKAGRDFIVEHG